MAGLEARTPAGKGGAGRRGRGDMGVPIVGAAERRRQKIEIHPKLG